MRRAARPLGSSCSSTDFRDRVRARRLCRLAHVRPGPRGPGNRRLLVRDVRDLLGVGELRLVRLGVRHRRLAVPADDDGADGRRARARDRPAGDVRLPGARRSPRQPHDGLRLRHHARRDDRPMGAREQGACRAARDLPQIRAADRDRSGSLGRDRDLRHADPPGSSR